MSAQSPITFNAVTDTQRDVARVYTEGMAEFGRPELECYWSPAGDWWEALRLLEGVARHLDGGPPVADGDTLEVYGHTLRLRFQQTAGRGWAEDGRLLRVEKLTTGEEGVSEFRRQVGVDSWRECG